MLAQLGQYVGQRFTTLLEPLNLQPRHFGILSQLLSTEGQTQQELADRLGIHRNVMVTLIDDLETRGLVERRPHATKRRANALYATPAGKQLMAQANRLADRHDETLLEGLNPDEQQRFTHLLNKVIQTSGLDLGVHPSLQTRHQQVIHLEGDPDLM